MNRLRAHLLLRLLGPLLLLAILIRVDLQRLRDQLGELRPLHLLWVVIPLVLSLFVKGRRWNRLAAGHAVAETTLRSTHVYAVGVFYGMLTPGRVGEVWKASVLAASGMPTGRALGLCVLDRMLDLGSMALLALGILLPRDPRMTIALWLAGGVFVILFLHTWRYSAPRLSRLVLRRESAAAPAPMRAQDTLEAALWTLVFWILYFAQVGGLMLAAGFWLPPEIWIPAAAAAAIVSMLPISFMGLGTREAAMLALLSHTGVPGSAIVLFSLLYVYIYLVGASIGWVLSLKRIR